MSLANKHRPQIFDHIIGQNHITNILQEQIKSEKKNNHNYLFFGPRGTGKTTAARILAKAINCLDSKDGNPCNKCANCETINKGQTLDYVEIDAASHTGVDNIRDEILAKVGYPATQLKKKIYVIDEVHMLSKGAFNALLKTIEEPKDNICFILATTEIHKVPETIISRCQVFNFKKVVEDEMVDHLKNICDLENLKFEDDALKIISKISEGCVRDAVKYVDQIGVFGDINQKNITSFLGVAGDSLVQEFLEIIKLGDKKKVFEKVDNIQNSGIDLVQFAKQNIMYIDQNLVEDMDFLLEISETFGEIISNIKYYPHPTIVYKIALNKHLKANRNNGDTKSKETKNTVEKTENVVEKNTEKVNEEANNLEIQKTNGTYNEKTIMEKLIESIDSKTMKDSLRNHTIIKGITNGKLNLIVINKLAEISLNKENTKKMIEQKLFEITGEKLVPNIEFMDKEEYFANQI